MLYNHHHSSIETIAFEGGPGSGRPESSSMTRKTPQLLKRNCANIERGLRAGDLGLV